MVMILAGGLEHCNPVAARRQLAKGLEGAINEIAQ
jgi:hypothetical protein